MFGRRKPEPFDEVAALKALYEQQVNRLVESHKAEVAHLREENKQLIELLSIRQQTQPVQGAGFAALQEEVQDALDDDKPPVPGAVKMTTFWEEYNALHGPAAYPQFEMTAKEESNEQATTEND